VKSITVKIEWKKNYGKEKYSATDIEYYLNDNFEMDDHFKVTEVKTKGENNE